MKSSRKEQDMKEGATGKTTTKKKKRRNRRARPKSALATPPFWRSHLGNGSVPPASPAPCCQHVAKGDKAASI